MYHLYIVKSIGGRIGFGIATDLKERNKHYASHSGDIVQFPLVFGGLRAHAKAVEKTIKREYEDHLWQVDDWKTEWLKKEVYMEDFEKFIMTLIKERHYKLEVVKRDYNFLDEL